MNVGYINQETGPRVKQTANGRPGVKYFHVNFPLKKGGGKTGHVMLAEQWREPLMLAMKFTNQRHMGYFAEEASKLYPDLNKSEATRVHIAATLVFAAESVGTVDATKETLASLEGLVDKLRGGK